MLSRRAVLLAMSSAVALTGSSRAAVLGGATRADYIRIYGESLYGGEHDGLLSEAVAVLRADIRAGRAAPDAQRSITCPICDLTLVVGADSQALWAV